jgi:hypothetical protein
VLSFNIIYGTTVWYGDREPHKHFYINYVYQDEIVRTLQIEKIGHNIYSIYRNLKILNCQLRYSRLELMHNIKLTLLSILNLADCRMKWRLMQYKVGLNMKK